MPTKASCFLAHPSFGGGAACGKKTTPFCRFCRLENSTVVCYPRIMKEHPFDYSREPTTKGALSMTTRPKAARGSLKECSSSKAAPLSNSLASRSRKFPMRSRLMNADPCYYSFRFVFFRERIHKCELEPKTPRLLSPVARGEDHNIPVWCAQMRCSTLPNFSAAFYELQTTSYPLPSPVPGLRSPVVFPYQLRSPRTK